MSKKKRRDIPQFHTPIIETHCHLDYLESMQLDQVLAKSGEVGVERDASLARDLEQARGQRLGARDL